ncbi:MAG: superoxide dismutase [Ni] [Planctomycetota bacterium]
MRYPLCLLTALFVGFAAQNAAAHCQVPCGIYGDQLRFQSMLEDQSTIEKAAVQVGELSEDPTPQNINQMVRWVSTKESHASNIQAVIADYFMAQRIKADGDNYGPKLMTAHAVMVAAMKAKQSSTPETAVALKKAIFDFYKAYEGKDPEMHSHD